MGVVGEGFVGGGLAELGIALAGGLWALLAGVLAPGALCIHLAKLDRGREPLEKLVLSLAFGRLLLALLTLVTASTVGAWALHGFALLAVAGCGVLLRGGLRRGTLRPGPASLEVWAPVLVALVCAGLLVGAVLGHQSTGGAGDLVFFGRDTTNDPLIYGSMALELRASGLPLTNPFAAGMAWTSSYVPFAFLAGLLELARLPVLELVFRGLPLFESAGLGLGAVALMRALGAPLGAQCLAPALLLLAGDASTWLLALGGALGFTPQALDSWALFGPYLLPFNPIAPALQTWLAALLLLARPGKARRAHAIAAGALFAALFEIKVFLWAPALVGLVAVAVWRPPRALAPSLRLASLTAVAASLPSLVEKALWAVRLQGSEALGFRACVGCLPRYLVDASLGSHDPSFRIFESFSAGRLLDPGWLATTVALAGVAGAAALGARWVAVPRLWRMAREDRAEDGEGSRSARAAVARLVGVGAAAGLGAAAAVGVAPHFLNAAQFAWLAGFGLWIFVAWVLTDWLAAGRLVAAFLVGAAALPGSHHGLVRLGLGAPRHQVVSVGEARLMDALAAASQPGELVLEPSMIQDTDTPSPVTFLAGRPVYMSLLSQVVGLPEPERRRRFDHLLAFFVERDPEAARAALRASGARLVYVPAGFRPVLDLERELEPVAGSPAGRIYRAPQTRASPGGPVSPESAPTRSTGDPS